MHKEAGWQRITVVCTVSYVFCFLYTLLYLPENWEKRAHWVLPQEVFHAPSFSWTMRIYFALTIATSVTLTVAVGYGLQHLTRKSRRYDPRSKDATHPQSSLAILLKEYSLLVVCATVLYGCLYLWCYSRFIHKAGFTYTVASNFFVDSLEASHYFAWISAGFYTSVLLITFLDPIRTLVAIFYRQTSSDKAGLILAAFGGFGGFAGVGGVLFLIAADFVDIISTLLGKVVFDLNFLLYIGTVLGSISVTYLFYFGFGFTLHTIWYVQQKHLAERWKCQPKRWLSFTDHKHEILLGSFNMFLAASVGGSITFWIFKGGYSSLYFTLGEYGYFYLPVSIVVLFVYTDAVAYYAHRMFHSPTAYKKIHKWHHRYKAPTAFAASAMHPFEFLTYQSLLILPMFVLPMYFAVYVGMLAYLYYFGMIDHSGINFSSIFPWQPSSKFHDDHHKFFHCNFGQNTLWFDSFHDTLRTENRSYGEKIFGGHGISNSTAQPVPVSYK